MKKFVSKIYFIILAAYGTITSNSNCMITNAKFKPYIQSQNPALNKWREEVEHNTNHTTGEINQIGDYFHHCHKIGEISKEKTNEFVCYQYAIQETTGFTKFMTHKQDQKYLFAYDYFEQTPHPQPNDLVIYGLCDTFPCVTHFAVATDAITFRSKWEMEPDIWEHRLFDIPRRHGKAAYFFTLKPKYKTPEGKELLIRDIEQKKQTYLQRKTPVRNAPYTLF